MSCEQKNIKVVVRVRPYNQREMQTKQRCIVKVMDETALLFDPEEEDDEFFYQGSKQNYRDITKKVNKKISMEFDRVFDTDTNNIQIFEDCTQPLIDSVLNGYNCSVFVYGATGAGKTFTMLGSESCPGLTFLTMRDLFEKIASQENMRKFDVGVSYLEVYNEQVMNLLTKSGPLQLREDSHGVVVSGLALKPIYSAEELLQLLQLGNSNRTQHPTDANAESSRSHAVFQVHIRMTERKTGIKRTVKLSMIDLAGSERAASTKGLGMRFKEGANINKSLLALGNCINKLADGSKHIPYRDSKLTRILKDSLGGNCQTLMVANVSMSSTTYEDTYNTLKYASRAKKIRTTLRQNVLKSNMSKDFYVRKLDEVMAENEKLKNINKSLEAKIALLQQKTTTSESLRVGCYNEKELKPWYSKIDAVYSNVIKTQEYKIGLQSKIKNLNFQIKLKEDAWKIRKILLEDERNEEDFTKFTSSIANLNAQVDRQNDELSRWSRKLSNADRDLKKLKDEILESKYSQILQIYQKSKDFEIETSEQNININHFLEINSEFLSDTNRMRQAFTMACGVVKDCVEDLKSVEKYNLTLQTKYEKMLNAIKSNCLVFKNCLTEISDVDLSLNGKENHAFAADSRSDSSINRSKAKKRRISDDMNTTVTTAEEDTEDSDCYTAHDRKSFKKPIIKKSNSLNETRILTQIDLSKNTCLDQTIVINKKEFVSDMLSDKIVRVSQNKDKLRSILIRSRADLINATASLPKDSEKYSPNRICKSPRLNAPKAKKNAPRGAQKKSEAPTVRTNRAAIFRLKK